MNSEFRKLLSIATLAMVYVASTLPAMADETVQIDHGAPLTGAIAHQGKDIAIKTCLIWWI